MDTQVDNMTGWYQISDHCPGSAGCIGCLTQLGADLTAGQSPVSAPLRRKWEQRTRAEEAADYYTAARSYV